MKKTLAVNFLVLALQAYGTELPADPNQTADTTKSYAVVERGAINRVWERVSSKTGSNGQQVFYTNRYTELATGLHYQDANGQWVESKEQIELQPDGSAAALQGQHKVYFPADLYQGFIEMVTADGQHYKSQPLGLFYDDGTNTVLIAQLKDTTGQLVGSNQVIYPDAFTDFKADVRYTYRKSGLEQDIILREQPPVPAAFGLNPDNTRLQMLTEFIDTVDPVQKALRANAQDRLSDSILTFGSMKMMQGRAFLTDDTQSSQRNQNHGLTVYKQWVHLEGRSFLAEQLPVRRMTAQLEALPIGSNAIASAINSLKSKVSAVRQVPRQHFAQEKPTKTIRVAQTDMLPKRGVVLDYITLSGFANGYTFKGDTTYVINGSIDVLYPIVEGGTVIKFAPDAGGLFIYYSVDWKAGPYRPVVMTSINDDSVGETISGSSGTPSVGTGYYLTPGAEDGTVFKFNHLRVLYAGTAINHADFYEFWDSQFVQCGTVFDAYNSTFSYTPISFNNVLFSRCNFIQFTEVPYLSISGSHVTADRCNYFEVTYGDTASFAFTNSLFQVTNWTGSITLQNSYTGVTNAYQTAGAGNYYLANGSPYRNAGTTNIDPAVLADIRTKTTYPPIVYGSGYYGGNIDLYPQAQRDTDQPDLGYHYDPLDYIMGGMFLTNSAVTLNPGTCLGTYGTSSFYGPWGLGLENNSSFSSQGLADRLNHVALYNTVQEQETNTTWVKPVYGQVASADPNSAGINCRFTDWSAMAQDASHLYIYYSSNAVNLQDCQFHEGYISTLTPISLSNCLLDRVYLQESVYTGTAPIYDCTFFGGTLVYAMYVTNSPVWNNLFDHTSIPNLGITYVGGNNAFVTNCDRLYPTNVGDILINTLTYQTGPLGNFYLPTNSVLINRGSNNADLLGLYQYTITTNQWRETNSIVDIGYHYVAVDASGNPVDTDGDGIPNYLEDANGNGTADGGEGDWLNYNSQNDLATGTGIRVFTPLK